MRLKFAAVIGAVVLVVEPASAINKCTDPSGRVTFQDAPCVGGRAEAIEAKPASGRAVGATAAATAPASAGAPMSEAARLEGIVSASQNSRRARDLRERVLPDAERALSQHRVTCAERQKSLAANQYIYQQNMYGKTHAAQIASEMAAAAVLCDTKDRELKELVDSLIKECAGLKCRG